MNVIISGRKASPHISFLPVCSSGKVVENDGEETISTENIIKVSKEQIILRKDETVKGKNHIIKGSIIMTN